jgi:predicted ribonuclease YlaK
LIKSAPPIFVYGGDQNLIENIGTKTLKFTDEQIQTLYMNPTYNIGHCMVNEYLNVQISDGKIIGPWLWDGERYHDVPFRTFKSTMFGQIKPKEKDPYQMAYMDSLTRNQLTIATGPAGSGKSLIALAYAFQEFEKGALSKIVIFVNPWIASSAVKLGFLPGSKVDKLMETSIGSILISKLGSRQYVEDMIHKESLVLMPMGDCRGYEVPNDSFVYFTEAQNTNRYLMKLFLQRTNDSCKICIEGDERQQDHEQFHNGLNGLIRAVEVFRGEPYAGHVRLQNIYRGAIARKAEEI